MVTCGLKHQEFIRTLRNDSRVKDGFIQQNHINEKDHAIYMDKYSQDYFICINDDEDPMGYVGIVNNDIRICTHPNYQRMGVALFMLKEMDKLMPDAVAKIKIENKQSQALFEKAGFEPKYYLYERKKHKT